MPDDLADLERLRATVVGMRAMINDKRTPSGTRKRATRTLADTAVSVCDTALALLRDRQAEPEDFVP